MWGHFFVLACSSVISGVMYRTSPVEFKPLQWEATFQTKYISNKPLSGLMLTSACQPWVILANEVNPCWPQTRARLITCWDEDWLGGNPIGTKGTSIVTKKFLYVYKVKLESMFEQWLYRPTQAVVVVVFLHDKVFFNSCSGPLDFFYTLSLKLV